MLDWEVDRLSAEEMVSSVKHESAQKSSELLSRDDDRRLFPRYQLTDMAEPRATQFCVIGGNDKLQQPIYGTKPAIAVDCREHSSLRLFMDNSAWDIVYMEVMDWRDASWTSMDLPEAKTCMSPPFFIVERDGRRL